MRSPEATTYWPLESSRKHRLDARLCEGHVTAVSVQCRSRSLFGGTEIPMRVRPGPRAPSLGFGCPGGALSSIRVDIPVRCTRCGAVGTSSNLIGGDGSGSITLTDVTLVGGCPVCGGDMKPPDGTYEFEKGMLTALRTVEPARLRQVRDVLRQATEEQITPDLAAEQVAAVAPELSALLARLPHDKSSLVWVQTLLAALTVVLAWMALHQNAFTETDHELLQRDIRTAIEQVHQPNSSVSPGGTVVPLPAPKAVPPPRTKQRKKR
jgi:hypothetical protein